MAHRQGKKITASHTTLSDLSKEVVDFLNNCEWVSKISIGVISNTSKSANPIWTVKIIDEVSGILIRTTQKSSNQQLRFYSNSLENREKAKKELADWVQDKGWKVRY